MAYFSVVSSKTKLSDRSKGIRESILEPNMSEFGPGTQVQLTPNTML